MVKSGANRYRYDACGRLLEKIVNRHGFRPQRWQYRWNSDNRLTDLYTPNAEHWRYQYDAFGRRMRKFNFSHSNNHDTNYAHSEKHIVGEEYLWSGEQLLEAAPIYADGTVAFEHATRWSYAPGGITPLAQQQGGKLWYVVSDHLGTPRELLDESGQLGWSNSPSVWGQARLWQAANDEFASSNVVPINKTTCPMRFPGQYYDEESGLHYNRHRYYDPETAQYLSPDPLGLGGGVRPQGYVDNPLSWVDPLGLAEYNELKKDSKLGNDGSEIARSTTKKGQEKVEILFENISSAKNWSANKLGLGKTKIHDGTGKWIGWKNKSGDEVYWGHGDWGQGVGKSTFPHLNYKIDGVSGHLFLRDKIINRGQWDEFAGLF